MAHVANGPFLLKLLVTVKIMHKKKFFKYAINAVNAVHVNIGNAYIKVGQPFQNGGQMRLSRAVRGPELQTKTQNEDAYYYNIFIANQANQ